MISDRKVEAPESVQKIFCAFVNEEEVVSITTINAQDAVSNLPLFKKYSEEAASNPNMYVSHNLIVNLEQVGGLNLRSKGDYALCETLQILQNGCTGKWIHLDEQIDEFLEKYWEYRKTRPKE